MMNVIIKENQYKIIEQKLLLEANLELAKKNWKSFTKKEKELATKIAESFYPQHSKILKEAEWYNMVGDILGIVDPTGIVDIVNAISYFKQGDDLFGILTLISAIPYAGDIVAKPVLGSLKIGGGASKGLKVAMKAAKDGEITKATEILTKLSKEPGVVGKFLQSAKTWAPKVSTKVDKLPGGIFKGFKQTIMDYLKLFETAGAKSLKFQKYAGNLAKNIDLAVKPAENIKALQSILKNEKIFSGLSKKGPLSQIFLGGVPRLFGNRQMRILMRQTKTWLGFLDFLGVHNFVGPDEIENTMSRSEIEKKFAEYSKTENAKRYAEEDFQNAQANGGQQTTGQENTTKTTTAGSEPLQNFFQNLFSSQLGKAAIAGIS
jgi:hypothetical protein